MKRIVKAMTLLLLTLPLFLYAGTLTGKVTEADNGGPMEGANVTVEGTQLGAATDANGMYRISNVPDGTYKITVTVIGYEKATKNVAVAGIKNVNFVLTIETLNLSDLEVLASRATRDTPVAYSQIDKADMEFRLGSQDIPMALNITPSVYATQQGGGAGDARINVRGFNQRNISVMINGVPQNDMENGWVYWSNWDGVGDATSSIQMQRGLSAVNLATPSIGGTMNIITDPAALSSGAKFKREMGLGNFVKTTFSLNTGLIQDKYAFSASIVRKTADGVIDKTWTDAWAYYLGASYAMNENNRFEVYAIGAPQRHGQNLYKQNVAAYDKSFAQTIVDKSMKTTDSNDDGTSDWEEYFAKFSNDAGGVVGRTFNQNWSPINPNYNGKQYWYMYGKGGLFGSGNTDRHSPDYLNERENFFHKPLVNLNWFLTLNEQMRLSSIVYWSGGSGGGTGTYGRIPTMDADGNLGGENYKFYYGSSPWTRDWNTLLEYNSGPDDTVYVDKHAIARDAAGGESVGILRNSINRQWTIGAISKLNYDYSSELKFQVGLDWRTAEIEHAREVRDLMGGQYYTYTGNDFDTTPWSQKKKLGDIIAYHNTNTVDWVGLFGQGEYQADQYSAYAMLGWSSIKYTFVDHFTNDGTGHELSLNPSSISAFQVKGGGMYHATSSIDVFANLGYVQKVPILDAVIDDVAGTIASDPANEIFQSVEGGLNYHSYDGKVAVKANLYNTQWKDRTVTVNVEPGQGSSGDSDIIFLKGLDQTHSGFELEAAYTPMPMVRFDASFSLGKWEYVGDAKGDYKNYSAGTSTEYVYAVKGLKVGDMPQQSFALAASIFPIKGLSIQGVLNSYANHYADWAGSSGGGFFLLVHTYKRPWQHTPRASLYLRRRCSCGGSLYTWRGFAS